MEHYYAQQAQLPHFSGPARQRGSGFGSLAAGVGRLALPFAKKVFASRCQVNWQRILITKHTRVA